MPIIYLVGNKIDLKEQRNVSEYEREGFAEKQGFLFKEISIKNVLLKQLMKLYKNLLKKFILILVS